MKRLLFKIALVTIVMMGMTGCGGIHFCKSYSPYELDWYGYNSVIAFQQYFDGYEETIQEHIGDTVKVYGCTHYKIYGEEVDPEQQDNDLLKSFFDISGPGHLIFVDNDANIDIPVSFYDKTLYVTGSVIYFPEMGCNIGTGLQLIRVDTIP